MDSNLKSEVMQLSNEKKHFSLLGGCLLIAVFGSSIIGAQIGPISLNKIALIPLLIYLICACLINNTRYIQVKYINKDQIYWYLVCIFSCLVSLFRSNIGQEFKGYYSNSINYLIQIVLFYIPLILLIAMYPQKRLLIIKFKNALIFTCRIQMIWALLQFILYTGINYDLNQQILVNVLGGLGRETWTNFLWNYTPPVLRISGLNYDGAFLGYFLLIGLIFDEKRIFKVAYLAVILISMQRSALLGAAFVAIFFMLNRLINLHKHTSIKPIVKYVLLLLVLIVIFLVVLNKVTVVNDYFTKFMSRFDFLQGSSSSVSSQRHMLYLPYAIKTLFSIDPSVFLIGIGPRSSGIALTLNISNLSSLVLSPAMYVNAWAIECDFAELLLGSGLIGTIFYYLTCYSVYKKGTIQIKLYIVSLVAIGFMYGFSHLTITHLLLMFAYLYEKTRLIKE